MVKTEALLELGDLAGERGGIAGRALEDLYGDRAAVGRAEQAVDDLQFALLAVAVVAELGQGAAAALHVARSDVIEHQRAAGEMAAGQRRLNGGLAHRQPVEGAIEFLLVDRPQAEFGAETGGGGVGRERARRRELRARIEHPADDERQDEIPAAAAGGPDEPVESDLAGGAERRGDMAVRQRADDADRLPVTWNDRAAP